MDDGEEVVEIMGDATGKLANRLHFSRLMQLFLALFLFGDVLFYRDKMADFSIAPLDGCDGHFLVIRVHLCAG